MENRLQRQTLLYALLAVAGGALIAGAAALSCMRWQKPLYIVMAFCGGMLLLLSRALYAARLRRLSRRPVPAFQD